MNALWLLPLLVTAAAQDTVRLPSLQSAAVERDPRARQFVIQQRATELRLRNFAAERLPSFTIRGEAIHQSEVPSIPIRMPGVAVPEPPNNRYEAALELEERIYDGGTLNRRRSAEAAHLRAEQARIAAALYPLRSEVNQAFFGALLVQTRVQELELLISDLQARLDVLRAQVRDGAALPGDTAAVRAELLQARQAQNEAAAERRAAVAVLAELTGVSITATDVLLIPDYTAAAAEVHAALQMYGDTFRAHPRYAVFEAEREQLRQRALLLDAQARPQVAAFGQLAYGRPGLKQFTDEFHEYWMAGVRLRWQPWRWGTTARERELLRIEQEIVASERAAFTAQLQREVQDEWARIEQVQAALALDEEIIALRAQVERQAGAQLTERAITPDAYVDARTDLLEARLALRRHQIELAQASAQYLTLFGVVPR